MASGYFDTNSKDKLYYRLEWSSSTNIDGNYSTVYYTLSARGLGNKEWVAERTLRAYLGGNEIINKTYRVERYSGVIKSGSFTVYHNDVYGTASISGSVDAAVYGSSVNVTGSGSWNLDTIPRKPILRLDSVYNVGINECRFHYTPTREINFYHLQYRLNGGGAVQEFGNDVHLKGLSPNTNYNLQVRGIKDDWSLYGDWSNTISFRTQDFPRITSAYDFNDESTPEIKFTTASEPYTSSVDTCISWTGGADIPYRNAREYNGSYTYYFTPEEKQTIYNAMWNRKDMPAKFYIRSVSNGVTYYSTKDITIYIKNGEPVFKYFTYYDTDSTQSVIKDNQKFLEGYGDLNVLIANGNGAVAQKGARITSYKVEWGGAEKSVDYADPIEIKGYPLYDRSTSQVSVTAIDSRNNVTKVNRNITILPYRLPYLNSIKFERDNFIGEEVSVIADGGFKDYVNGMRNTPHIYFKLKEEPDSEYLQIDGLFDYSNSEFKNKSTSLIIGKKVPFGKTAVGVLKISDLFKTVIVEVSIDSGKVLMSAVKGEGVGINCVFDPKIGKGLQVQGGIYLNGKPIGDGGGGGTPINPYPVGSVYMSVNSTDPSTLFGGTWERLKGGFLYGAETGFGTGNGTGTNTNNHTLTTNEMPSHSHGMDSSGNHTHTYHGFLQTSVNPSKQWLSISHNKIGDDPISTPPSMEDNPSGAHTHTIKSTGGGAGHSHRIPYIAVFMWRRTS